MYVLPQSLLSLFVSCNKIVNILEINSTYMWDWKGAYTKFCGVSRSEERGVGDNSIQFINFERVGDQKFSRMATKLRVWNGG